MIVFINANGNPLSCLVGLLLCVAINVLFDHLVSLCSGPTTPGWNTCSTKVKDAAN